ncbi:hypothetical protein R1flu_023124 [Riccia fluitans]|uniref:Uncharacterized protein n=1 Tax=Riccia fluitans TaxID=41844 RepID=A0ABD1XR55_9MARC
MRREVQVDVQVLDSECHLQNLQLIPLPLHLVEFRLRSAAQLRSSSNREKFVTLESQNRDELSRQDSSNLTSLDIIILCCKEKEVASCRAPCFGLCQGRKNIQHLREKSSVKLMNKRFPPIDMLQQCRPFLLSLMARATIRAPESTYQPWSSRERAAIADSISSSVSVDPNCKCIGSFGAYMQRCRHMNQRASSRAQSVRGSSMLMIVFSVLEEASGFTEVRAEEGCHFGGAVEVDTRHQDRQCAEYL